MIYHFFIFFFLSLAYSFSNISQDANPDGLKLHSFWQGKATALFAAQIGPNTLVLIVHTIYKNNSLHCQQAEFPVSDYNILFQLKSFEILACQWKTDHSDPQKCHCSKEGTPEFLTQNCNHWKKSIIFIYLHPYAILLLFYLFLPSVPHISLIIPCHIQGPSVHKSTILAASDIEHTYCTPMYDLKQL